MVDDSGSGDDGPLDTTRGFADPAAFEDGDGIDSAAILEGDDGYQLPADPGAEPADDDDDGESGGDS